MWDKISYPFPNVHGCTIDVWSGWVRATLDFGCNHYWSTVKKTNDCRFDNFVVTGGTVSCRYDTRHDKVVKLTIFCFQWSILRLSWPVLVKSTGMNRGCIDRCQCLLPRWTTHAVVKTYTETEIFITGCTGSCQNDNFQCSQWLKFRQNDDIFVSVYMSPVLLCLFV